MIRKWKPIKIDGYRYMAKRHSINVMSTRPMTKWETWCYSWLKACPSVKTEKNIVGISSGFTCICQNKKGWITPGVRTKSCPACHRKYIGWYNPKTLHIEAIEVNKR